jgi:dUTP pyrophosphatase
MNIKCVKLDGRAKLPSRNNGDNGFDLSVIADDKFSNKGNSLESQGKKYWLGPGERYLFSTGLKIQLPPKHFAMIRGRSGLAHKHGIHILGGLIDESYLGEWKVILYNTSNARFEIAEGDRIAQFVVLKDDYYDIIEVQESDLEETNRGEKGFGSSGVK